MQERGSQPLGRAGRLYAVFLSIVCALLAVEVAVLAVRNHRLEAVVAAASPERAEPPARPRLQVGDVLETFTLRRHDGSIETVALDGTLARTLLVVFAEKCPACPLVMPAWRELAPSFEHASRRVVGIRLDPPAEGAAPASETGFPVRFVNDVGELPFAKLTTVPLTVLLDEWGIVLWVRYGELGAHGANELLGLLE